MADEDLTVAVRASLGHLRCRSTLPDPWTVDAQHQMHALSAVEDRLRQHFPDVDAAVVEAAVRLAHAEVAIHIHDAAPLLVERAARNRLSYALPEQPLHGA